MKFGAKSIRKLGFVVKSGWATAGTASPGDFSSETSWVGFAVGLRAAPGRVFASVLIPRDAPTASGRVRLTGCG